MGRPSNQQKLERLRAKVEASKKWRKDEGFDDLWDRMVNLYKGRPYNTRSKEDRMVVNLAFSNVNTIVPSLAVNNPRFTVAGQQDTFANQAIIAEAVLNHGWRTWGFQSEVKDAVKDSRIVGHGWLKTTWKFVEKSEHPERMEGADEGGTQDALPLEFVGDEELPVAENAATTQVTDVREDRPVVERVSFRDMFVDPDATSMSNLGWIAQRVRRPLGEVRRDRRYKPVRLKVTASYSAKFDDEKRSTSNTSITEDQGYVDVWEFYDIRAGVMAVFADTGNDFLIDPTPIPFAMGQPFTLVPCHSVPDQFYPMGDLEAIEPLLLELNETRSQMMNHRKKYSRKWLYKEKYFDPRGRQKLEDPSDNVMVPVVGDAPLNDVVAAMPAVTSPSDFYSPSDVIKNDIDVVGGVSDYQRGGAPEIRRTATEAGIMADAANARMTDALTIIETAMKDVASRAIGLMQQFMTGVQVARVSGPMGTMWVNYKKEWIDGKFDFEIEAGSSQPNNESFRRQTALQMVDAMAPFAQFINIPALVEHLLQFGFGIKNPTRFIMQPSGAPQGAPGQPPVPADPSMGQQPPMGQPPMPQAGTERGIPPELLALLGGAPAGVPMG